MVGGGGSTAAPQGAGVLKIGAYGDSGAPAPGLNAIAGQTSAATRCVSVRESEGKILAGARQDAIFRQVVAGRVGLQALPC